MTDLCHHLIDSGLDLPFVLVNTPTAHAFTCPACTVEWIIAMQGAGVGPWTILDAIHFDRCEHGPGTCFDCLKAMKRQMSSRVAELRQIDKRVANRLHRLSNVLSRRYDRPAIIRTERQARRDAKRTAKRAQKLPAYPGLRGSGRVFDAAIAAVRSMELAAQRRRCLVPAPVPLVVVPPVVQSIAQ